MLVHWHWSNVMECILHFSYVNLLTCFSEITVIWVKFIHISTLIINTYRMFLLIIRAKMHYMIIILNILKPKYDASK